MPRKLRSVIFGLTVDFNETKYEENLKEIALIKIHRERISIKSLIYN